MLGKVYIVFMFSVSCELLGNAFGYPDISKRSDEYHPDCPKQDKGMATLLPHESDCGLYYMCQSRVAILKHCPDDLHFNPTKKVCDFPDRAGCQIDEEGKKVFRSNGFPHPDCPSKDSEYPVIIPHESECTKFYICERGIAHEKTCMFDLFFNPKLRVCDYPENVDCAHGSPGQKGEEKPQCPKINKSIATLLPHETDCSLYYICESGDPILRFCPDDLHFNPRKRVCDFPDRAGCQKEEIVQLARLEATGSPSIFCPLINGEFPVFYPHPSNCSVYYMCGNGLAYEFVCPSGLHFNVRLKVCDTPLRARCQN